MRIGILLISHVINVDYTVSSFSAFVTAKWEYEVISLSEWGNVWLDKYVIEWVSEWVSQWMSECWMSELEWVSEWGVN